MDNAVAGGFGLISARKTLYKRKILLELIRRGWDGVFLLRGKIPY